MMKRRFLLMMMALLSLTALNAPLTSQNTPAISLSMPMWMEWIFQTETDILADFEQEFGVRVEFIPASIELTESMNPYAQDSTIDDYLDAVEEYVTLADVLYSSPFETFRPEAIAAGYYLDLAPLMSSDSDIANAEFYPGMLEAFQWDGGTWGIPATGELIFLGYDREAFDAAGLSYPNQSWTIDDFDNAIRTLTEFNADGQVVRQGFNSYGSDTALVLRSLYGRPFYDPASEPAAPRFNTPELINLIERWGALHADGYFSDSGGIYNAPVMRIARRWELQTFELPPEAPRDMPAPPATPEPALLPGGIAGLDTTGFAVSAGTANPELAYELAKYLSEVLALRMGSFPARADFADGDASFGQAPQIDADAQAFLDRAYGATLSLGEQRYFNTVGNLVEGFREDPNLDVGIALQEAELEALAEFELALARQDTLIIVDAPPDEVVVGPGQSVLTFIIDEFMVSSNQRMWDEFVADFLAENPDIAAVEFSSFNIDEAEIDCLFNNARYLEQEGVLDDLIALDPFLDADPNFDRADLFANVLDATSVDGQTYGMPLSLGIGVLWYDPVAFENAGIPAPYPGWSIQEFEVALDSLRFNLDLDDDYVIMENGGPQVIELLVHAYGGEMWDTSVNPPTPTLTDDSTIAAIQAVLDLARRNDIRYYSLTGRGEGVTRPQRFDENPPMSMGYLSRYGSAFELEQGRALATLPMGQGIMPLEYDIEAAFIFKTADNPEACYNFISAMVARPDLLNAMPVSQSMIDDPAMDSLDPRVRDFFREFAAVVDESMVITPNYNYDFVEYNWIYSTFDRYVLQDEDDLAGMLTEAQGYVADFRVCKSDAGIEANPQFENEDDYNRYFELMEACAQQADPDYEPQFFGQ